MAHAGLAIGAISLLTASTASVSTAESPAPPFDALDVEAQDEEVGMPAEIALLLNDRASEISILVLNSSGEPVVESSTRKLHMLESVGKVYVLMAFLDWVDGQQRAPTDEEKELMADMIRLSDNDAAWELWKTMGRTEALQAFLVERGLSRIFPAEDDSWGSLRASAEDIAGFMVALWDGALGTEENTKYALSLLADVIEEQSWGVGANVGIVASPDRSFDATVYLKNGWYPEEDGWQVNSAGVIKRPDGDYYFVVALADSQPTLEEGIGRIEKATGLLNLWMLQKG